MNFYLGNTDPLFLFILAVIFAVLFFSHAVTGTVGIVLITLSVLFALNSLISFCPLYALFGISTIKIPK